MSQKYKSFSRGSVYSTDPVTGLPPGVKRMGYLKKLKKMKKRFFVLHMESNYGVARLEYYSSEKKWKYGCDPRRCIELKSCWNISQKLHSKHKYVIALYTKDDCFSVVMENGEELELWLKDIVDIQKSNMELDESFTGRPIYEHIWQVIIDKHDLETDKIAMGHYRVGLSSKSLHLIKMNPSSDSGFVEFPLMSIRRCGHTRDHFFIELGRSAVTGAGEIYMAAEATVVAQNMHETVLNAMKSSKIREDAVPMRPRSASSTENLSGNLVRRPIGVVAPQAMTTPVDAGRRSNSRERCDSLPNRSQSAVANSPYSYILSDLSSPFTTSGATLRKTPTSRPHSMYDWPSAENEANGNSVFSPNSPLSDVTGGGSSVEDLNTWRCHPLSYVFSPFTSDSNNSANSKSARQDEDYMKMASTNCENIITSCPVTKSPVPQKTEYMDMKSSSTSGLDSKQAAGFKLALPNNRTAPENCGYFDMSPTNCSLKDKQEDTAYSSLQLENTTSLGNLHEKYITASMCSNQSSLQTAEAVFSPISNQSKCNTESTTGPPIPDRNVPRNSSSGSIGPPIPKREHTLPKVQCEDQAAFHSDKLLSLNSDYGGGGVRVENIQAGDKNLPIWHTSGDYKGTSEQRDVCDIKNVHISSSVKPSMPKSLSEISSLKIRECNPLRHSQSYLDTKCAISSCEEANNNPAENDELLTYENIDIKPNDNPPQRNLAIIRPQISSQTALSDQNYSNIEFGKPVCPKPNPIPASSNSSNMYTKFSESKSPTALVERPKPKNFVISLPAFRKQMSAPACPPSLRPELPSPGRKSSCPVTSSGSMVRPSVVSVRPVHLRVANSKSPDHSSISSVSSASDEASSAHSSPKGLEQSFDHSYENVTLGQSDSRPSSVGSERELNYASLDLGQSEAPRSPTVLQQKFSVNDEAALSYAEIDFMKSEGLRNALDEREGAKGRQ